MHNRLRMMMLVLLSVFVTFVAAKEPAWQTSGAFEGDMLLDPDQMAVVEGNADDREAFYGIERRKWKGGRIPYTFGSSLDYRRRQFVQQAMAEYHRHTCVRWVQRSGETAYVNFIYGSGCVSYVGSSGRKQDLSLGKDCDSKPIAIHEMMHAVGFGHEQSRRDRDNYIAILFHNMNVGSYGKRQFDIYTHGDLFGEPYDTQSIMHYTKYAFSKWPEVLQTIQVRGQPWLELGNEVGFTQSDVRGINKMYGCAGRYPLPKQPVQRNLCDDQKSHCAQYKARGDRCDKGSYMYAYCKCSCKACSSCKIGGTASTTCKDNNPTCPDWAKGNGCARNPSYMYVNCKKSCGRC